MCLKVKSEKSFEFKIRYLKRVSSLSKEVRTQNNFKMDPNPILLLTRRIVLFCNGNPVALSNMCKYALCALRMSPFLRWSWPAGIGCTQA